MTIAISPVATPLPRPSLLARLKSWWAGPSLAPGFSTISAYTLASNGWKRGLSPATRAKLLGLSMADSYSDLTDAQERDQQQFRLTLSAAREQ